MYGWDMRETNIMDYLNCKMQAHTRVCENNKLEKNDAYWNNFMVEDVSLKDHIGRVVGACQDDILKDDSP